MNLGSARSGNYQPPEDNNEVDEEDKNEDEGSATTVMECLALLQHCCLCSSRILCVALINIHQRRMATFGKHF